MSIEMNQEEMERFYTEHPEVLPIHVGNTMFGWRLFSLTPEELKRLEIFDNNLHPSGKENYKLHRYVSRLTSIPLQDIDATSVQHEVLMVIPIVYRTRTILE